MDSERAVSLLIFTAVILLCPKVLGAFHALFFDNEWKHVRSRLRFVPGCLTEILLSALIAPIFMIAHVGAILNIVSGRDSGWATDAREGGRSSIRHAIKLYGRQSIIGFALAAFCTNTSPELAGWLAPVYVGLIFAPVISLISAYESEGLVSDSLRTPEDLHQPYILVASNRICDEINNVVTNTSPGYHPDEAIEPVPA
jgi:membrane glycosyltransferase